MKLLMKIHGSVSASISLAFLCYQVFCIEHVLASNNKEKAENAI